MSQSSVVTNRWSNSFAFVLAAAGSAVGLGNLWKFPYIMGEHGGGAFVLVYLVCIAVIGIPVMMAETYLGKQGRCTPSISVARVAEAHGRSRHWSWLGRLGVLTGFLIITFYVVIAGWALAYVFKGPAIVAADGDSGQIGQMFSALVASPGQLALWSALFMLLAVVVTGRGLTRGLEKAVTRLMPALFLLLILIVIYAMVTGDFDQAVRFMFYPDFSRLTLHSIMVAMGHAFFTLSLSSGIILMYGAYLPENASIAKSTLYIALMDTLVALLAGLAIYPIVFANGLAPGEGPGLLFVTLPLAFSEMPLGLLVSTCFFVMVSVAAFTSLISPMEPLIAHLVERKGWQRRPAAILVGVSVWLLSFATIGSFAGMSWAQVDLGPVGGTIFDLLDFLTASVMMPLGGLLIAVFVGWFLRPDEVRQMLLAPKGLGQIILFCLRYIAPLAILAIFLKAVGILPW